MKKHILSLAIVATMVGTIAIGCSSERSASGTDSVAVADSPASNSMYVMDTNKTPPMADTVKPPVTDTTRKPPM